MVHRRLRLRSYHALCVLILFIFALSGSLALFGTRRATAQIDNNQPTQPFASMVSCIRPGIELGGASHDSPRFATTCFGTKISTGGYTSNTDGQDANPNDAAVLDFGDATPDGTNDLSGSPTHTPNANLSQVGSVYGVAYSTGTNPSAPTLAQQRRLFVGAYTKTLTRYGSGGPGAIYLINRSTGAIGVYAQVPDVVPGPNGVPADPGDGSQAFFWNSLEQPAYTPEMGGVHSRGNDWFTNGQPRGGRTFAGVGKTSLGDIDLDTQERYLYTVNLNNKRVYRFDTWSANPQATITVLPALPALSSPAACNASGASGPADIRPFGVAVTAQSLYLGSTCAAERSQNRSDIAAFVSRYDLTSGAWAATTAVGFALAPSFDTQRGAALWEPWRNGVAPVGSAAVFAPQPMLSDIAFDEGGDMLIGLRDRSGDMNSEAPYSAPVRAEGDLLRATPSGTSGVWNAPSGAGAEFFADTSVRGTGAEPEAVGGGLAYVPGRHNGGFGGEVAGTFLDPYRAASFGAAWWDAAGVPPAAYEEIYAGGIGSHTFGKAAGLGDLELLCAWRAIGDRIWRDGNGNGTQDAGEPDISGVRLQLFAASDTAFSSPLATVTTGAVAGMSGNWRLYVNPFQAYRVRIDPGMFNAGQPLAGLAPTSANIGSDFLDSDANGAGVIDIPAAGDGDVSVTFDAGLRIQANVFISKTGPASAPVNGSIGYTLSYGNSGPSSATNVQLVDTLPGGLTFVSATPAPSSRSGQALTWNLGTLAGGANGTIAVNTTVNNNAPNSVTNNVSISTTTTETNASDNADTATTTIARPNVTIAKSGPASAITGASFAYTLVYRNTGAASAASVQVADTLPTGLTFASATPAPSSVSGQLLRWNLGALTAGANGTITINVTVAANAPANVTNVATISTTTSETNPNDNTGTSTTTITRPEVSIDKSGPAVAAVGASFAYTLAYRNTGTAAAANVQIVDSLPAGLTFVSATPAPSSVGGQTLSWNLGALAAGANGAITVNVMVDAGAPASLTNSAAISTTTPGDGAGNNTDTTTTSIPRSGVYIAKNGPALSTVGSTFAYTLSYGNTGGAAANNLTVVDTLPAELVFISAAPAPSSVSGQTLSWNLGALAAGATGSIGVRVQSVSSAADGAVVVNTAAVSTSTPGDDPSDNTSSATTTLQRAAVSIVKSSPTIFPVLAGQPITYYLDYANNGPADAADVVLDDTAPPQLTNVSWLCDSGCSASGTGNTASINLGALATGDSGRVTVTGTANTSAGREDFVNTAIVSTSTPETDTTNNQSSVAGAVWTADVQVIKRAQTQVVAGTLLTATLRYANNGPALASSVILTDTLPAGMAFVNAAPAPSGVSGQTLTWSLGDLAAGDSGVITLTLQSDAALPDQSAVTNQAQIGTPTVDRDASNNISSAQTRIVARADLAIAKTGPAIAVAGDAIAYTLTYTNAGPSVASNVLLTDTLPAALTFGSATPAPSSMNGQMAGWRLGDLPPGASGTIALQANSSAGQSQATITAINIAQIDSSTIDPTPDDNTSSATTDIQTADLSVVKAAPATIVAGVPFTATLDYANAGPAQATNATLDDILPAGLTVVSSSPPPGGPGLRWALGDVAAGASGRITLVLQAPTTAISGTAYINQAAVTTSAPDRDTSNDASSATSMAQKPDLSIVKTDGRTQAQPGDTLIYTLTIRNTGPVTATGVVLTDTLPAGLTPQGGGWVPGGDTVYTQAIGTIGPGAIVTRTMTIRLPNPLPASLRAAIVNGASVGDDGRTGPDPTPGNNSSSDQDTLLVGRVGDYVWLDTNGDGRQDTAERGLQGIVVQLVDPATELMIAMATTDENGLYQFDGLRMGQYQARLSSATTQSGPYQGYRLTTDPQPSAAISPAAPSNLTLDFGLTTQSTTAVVLAYFFVEHNSPQPVVRWGTLAERDTAFFRVVRATTPDRSKAVTVATLPSIGSQGGDYRLPDLNAPRSGSVYYWLIEVESDGDETVYGPATNGVQSKVYLSLVASEAKS